MSKIKPRAGIMDIPLYQGGAAHVEGVSNVVKLSSNEKPFGPSPTAVKAYEAGARSLHRYPSADHAELRNAIAEAHFLDAERIICGAGSDEIIAFLCQCYCGKGDEVIHTEHGFAMYAISARAAGAKPVEVKEQSRVTDVDAILESCTKKTKLVFIANPNNPTSTMIALSELERLAAGIPEQAILVLDGAYAEYVEGYDGGAALVEARENVVMTRTFSKIYGLGALRVGWGYAPKAIIDVLNRVRGPFNVNDAALRAALAAVQDQAYVAQCREANAKWRDWLAHALAAHGVPSDVSLANFILARFSSEEEADACDTYLQRQGLIVRRVKGYKLPNALRITVGDEASCRQVAHAVGQFKGGAR